MRWFPTTKIGKISFWLGVSSFGLMFIQYWTAMIMQKIDPLGQSAGSVFVIPGILAIMGILIAGVTSVIALTKYKDRAILLFIPVLIGLFGLFLVAGELFFPH